ncbi:Xaa-Pro aminopeptidase [Kribbella sp. VKM Ac-2527]|uniref:Xaa-Pro aminopeptidase n=1 Tax=Kribbella caucasensis TaxID=2512215 RepID=A0A4V3CAM9_9ACTN|nr:Xaa-Pro peptidase family protein [Kribbella sp. VKM Ac-2527]TDO50518.1 Xaa-Pro aminopeptidase [Kribbella sp. VKM Ac-2527]
MPPFNTQKLDQLMDDSGVSLVLATTRHNVQYLLGGYRYFFFANMDAIGVSRYLPMLGYAGDRGASTFYVGAGNEDWGIDAHPIWVDDVHNVSWSSVQAAEVAAECIRRRGLDRSTIAVEYAFIPADALDALRAALPEATFVDAHPILESLRGAKCEEELKLVRDASTGIIESMLSTFEQVSPGMTRSQIVEMFRREQTNRGLVFDYCLIATGPSLNRAPSDEIWAEGAVLSLDSGGMYHGYIGDLARMGVHGDPTDYMQELMDEIESVQQSARTVVKAGAQGDAIYEVAGAAVAECAHRSNMRFLAHGMGLITHEVPRLTATGPVPYPADHATLPLEAGNVLSIETWIEDPTVGFVKLEDTLIVTHDGYEAPGDSGRGYNVIRG